ncbi:glycosyltransferase family 2 protein [Flavobacterium sp. TMP13]|uniref:glycosyltransferase family 2 protein n=1 Tax=Flavobacterium sp. TMP13 TaxID=3425950 RepID=UPI003D76BE33
MPHQSPLVSVIITTYNRPLYLRLTINSVKNQTYENIEIIVVDDGTVGDENLKICNSYEGIKYIKTHNTKTPASGRNLGFNNSNGSLIAFLDDDDLWIENKIAIQVSILLENPDFGLVHSPCKVVNSDGLLQHEIIGESFKWRNKHGDVYMNMLGRFTLMMPTPLLRKELVEKVGLFNEIMLPAGEDVEFWTRCSFETKFYYYDQPLAVYRVHSKNLSLNKKAYIDLPLYLKKILVKQKGKNRISSEEYNLLLKICVKMQWQHKKDNFFRTLFNMFLIDYLFFVKFKKS